MWNDRIRRGAPWQSYLVGDDSSIWCFAGRVVGCFVSRVMDTKRTLWYLLLFLCAFLSILCQTGARKMRHNDGTGQHNYILRNELGKREDTSTSPSNPQQFLCHRLLLLLLFFTRTVPQLLCRGHHFLFCPFSRSLAIKTSKSKLSYFLQILKKSP